MLKGMQSLIKSEVTIFSIWWEEDDEQYIMVKEIIEDIQYHNTEISTS